MHAEWQFFFLKTERLKSALRWAPFLLECEENDFADDFGAEDLAIRRNVRVEVVVIGEDGFESLARVLSQFNDKVEISGVFGNEPAIADIVDDDGAGAFFCQCHEVNLRSGVGILNYFSRQDVLERAH